MLRCSCEDLLLAAGEERIVADDQRIDAWLRKGYESLVDLSLGAGVVHQKLKPSRARRRHGVLDLAFGNRIRWIRKISHYLCSWHKLVEHLQTLRYGFRSEKGHA